MNTESTPTMHAGPRGLVGGRKPARRDNGTREEFYAHFTAEHGRTWGCLLTTIDGVTFDGRGFSESSALNDAVSKMREANGTARTKGHKRGGAFGRI